MKTNKKQRKNTKGITLIALVITIIVLLILAGVSIAMLTGKNGILTQAQKAKNETEEAQDNELRRLTALEAATNLENRTFMDNSTEKEISVTIPAGFAISKVEGENTVKDGLVVIDSNGNEFVWIPVETPVAVSEAEGTTNKAIAIKQGNNYRGLLYDFTSNGSVVRNGCTTTTYDNREPDIITEYDDDTSYNNGLFTKESLQKEYNKIIESVIKYKGFYIGRYELGLEGTKPVTKNASINIDVTTTAADNKNTNMWYGLYVKCKEFAPENSNNLVVSSMMWGSQYDAMMNWMQSQGEDVTSMNDEKRNKTLVTGSDSNDAIKNIFDLYGAHYEWTLERGYTTSRVARGGHYTYSVSVSKRSYNDPTYTHEYGSTRIILYIK